MQKMDFLIGAAVHHDMAVAPRFALDNDISQTGASVNYSSAFSFRTQLFDIAIQKHKIALSMLDSVSHGIPFPDAVQVIDCRRRSSNL
jgi:hypothetical protein